MTTPLHYVLIVSRLVSGEIETKAELHDLLWSVCQGQSQQLMADSNVDGVPHAWGNCVREDALLTVLADARKR
jgi:hypothetical protein